MPLKTAGLPKPMGLGARSESAYAVMSTEACPVAPPPKLVPVATAV